MYLRFIFPSWQWRSSERATGPSIDLKRFYKRDLTAVFVIQRRIKLFLVCLHACHSCGTVSCKHVQTAQTHNPQTKPPVAGTPGKTGNTTSSQQHTRHSEDDFEQTRQSSFTTPWVTAHLHEQGVAICFFGSHADSMLLTYKHNNLLT